MGNLFFVWLFGLYDKVRLGSKPCEFLRVLLDFSRKSTGLWLFGFVAPFLLPYGRRISFSLPCAGTCMRRKSEMIKLLRQLVVIAMLGVASAGAFAQRKDQDKRPPKEPAKVITNDRKDQRPPSNSNQQRPKPDKPKRP
jgi:hypothetical protein